MTGVTAHGVRYPDGASKAKNLGPELQQMAEDLDDYIVAHAVPGPRGPVGPQGLPGVNAIAQDEAIATYLRTIGTQSRAAALELLAGHSGGALGWTARNSLGMADLNVKGVQDQPAPAADELARYTSGLTHHLSSFTSRPGWVAVPDTGAMSFTDGTFKSAWMSGAGTPSLDYNVSVDPGVTFRASAPITVSAAAPAANPALFTMLAVSNRDTMNTGNYLDRVGVGVNELNQPIIFSELAQSSAAAVQSPNPLPAGTYFATIIADEYRVSLTLTSADGATHFERVIARSSLLSTPGTVGALEWVSLVNRDSRGAAGNSIDKVDLHREATRTTSTAGSGWRELHWTINADSGDALRVDIPSTYDPRTLTPLIIFCHGTGRTAQNPGNDPTFAMMRAWTDAGYIVAAPHMHGPSPFGSPTSVTDTEALYEWLIDKYAIGPVLLAGASAGALTALTVLRRRNVPNVAGFYGFYPVTNLRQQYDHNPEHQLLIEEAFGFTGGANFATATAGYDPQQGPGWIYRGVPMRFTGSYDDTVVEINANAFSFAAKVHNYAPEAQVVVGTGAHGDGSQAPIADSLEFFARCLNRIG